MASALIVSLDFKLVVFLDNENQKFIGFGDMQFCSVDLFHLKQPLSSELLHRTRLLLALVCRCNLRTATAIHLVLVTTGVLKRSLLELR